MVSIKTVLTLGAIGVAVALFFGAGGFQGVGQKIGGFFGQGFSAFGSSLAGAFSGGLLGGAANPNTGGVDNTTDTSTGQIGPDPKTGTEEFDPFGNLLGNFKGLQNILDQLNNFFVGQGPAFVVGGQSFATAANPKQIASGTEFGGFISASSQAGALAALLAQNKKKFPEFF